jgi:hypothetical protein
VTWMLIAVAVAAGVEWRRIALLMLVVAVPLPMAGLAACHWWRARPGLSMRATRFCEAVSGELRAGASVRASVETAAVSVEAMGVARCCRSGASMDQVARAAAVEFGEIGPELGALLARADSLGVSPAALFDEIGALALAQVEVAHEVSIASAPAQRAAVLIGLALVSAGITVSVLILRRTR